MNRSLKLSVLVALALASSQALALGLGQIQVKSALDRPLVAVIPLHPDYPGEADHIKVSLAPAAAFASAGISRSALKVPLTFKVVTLSSGQKAIRITSTEPVRETYLDFLIQVTWPKGKMLREYTVLLDPLNASSNFATTTPATTGRKAAPPKPAPQAATPATGKPPAPPAAAAEPGTYGPVSYGDTLSHVAREDAIEGVSYQQMLVALKAANPDAFFQDNVNALKAGAVLRIPTRQEALAVTRKAAIAAVRQQNQAWQNQHAAAPTLVAGSGGSSAPITGAGSGNAGGDRLALVPPASKGAASAGAAGGTNTSASQLRQELARSQEALSSQKQAAADLTSRVAALEQLQNKNKRLLSLKNAEIAELQNKLAEARKAAGLPALPASTAKAGIAGAASSAQATVAFSASTAGASPAVATSTSGQSAAAASAGTVAVATPGAAGQAAKPQTAANHKIRPVPATATTHGAAAAPWYEQLWVRIALAVIIVLLIVWALLRRRKPDSRRGKSSLADQFSDSPLGSKDAAVPPDDEADLPEPVMGDDGENELLAQLAEHPDNVGLHLELASLYYARHDAGQFEAAAEAMHAYVDDESQPEWQEVVAMGRELVPDHPLFAAASAGLAAEGAHEASEDAAHAPHDFLDEVTEDAHTPVAPDDEDTAEALDDDHRFGFHPEPEAAAHDGEPEAFGTHRASSGSDALTGGMPDESEFDALPPLSPDADELPAHEERYDAPELAPGPEMHGLADELSTADTADDFAKEGFSDDPVDTKLDLARAYIDMGDHEGARAMLHEALHEGSQMQKDTAQKLLDELD